MGRSAIFSPRRATFVMADGQGIFTLDADASDRRNLGPGAFPSWTPDGRIIFTDGVQIWVMNADGTNRRKLTDLHTQQAIMPQLHGHLMVFTATDNAAAGKTDVWIANADGSSPRKIIPGGGQASLSPDGRWIAYTVLMPAPGQTPPYHVEVWRADVDGTNARQVTAPNDPRYPDANAPSVSPDGRKIAIFSGKESTEGPGQFSDPMTWGYRNVATISAEGGQRRVLTDCVPLSINRNAACVAADNPSWAPDGRQILYDRGSPDPANSGKWIINVDGTGNRRIWSSNGSGKIPMR